VMRSHSGRRGRGFNSVAVIQLFPSADYADFRRKRTGKNKSAEFVKSADKS
jgi:hypothetical protein